MEYNDRFTDWLLIVYQSAVSIDHNIVDCAIYGSNATDLVPEPADLQAG